VRESVGLPCTGLSWYEQQRVGTHWHVLPWLLIAGGVLSLLFDR
jgi:hypothetical protein